MFHVVQGDISDENILTDVYRNTSLKKKIQMDAIVNAAKPTLMGSSQGVDGAIHSKIDAFLRGAGEFNKKICEELEQRNEGDGNRIRCRRGQAVITKGYNLSEYIIHVVGSLYDGQYGWKKYYSAAPAPGSAHWSPVIARLSGSQGSIRILKISVCRSSDPASTDSRLIWQLKLQLLLLAMRFWNGGGKTGNTSMTEQKDCRIFFLCLG